MNFNENDAPILIVLGQSNAHGHGSRLPEGLEINTPLKNVLGLGCDSNQAYNLDNVKWSGYTSHGMNLGETQDHTWCLSTEFARMWQSDIDKGKLLPDLYIINISIGAQGIAENEKQNLNMWYPKRTPIMVHGKLDGVNISLYPLAVQTFNNAIANLKQNGKNPIILGLHWNQWETEVDTGGASITNAKRNYDELFDGFRDALKVKCKIVLYRPLSEVYNNPDGVDIITKLFFEYAQTQEDFCLMDISKSSLYDEARADKGIFQADLVHYSPEAHLWFAQQVYDLALSKDLHL